MSTKRFLIKLSMCVALFIGIDALAQKSYTSLDAFKYWERLNQIRRDKFDIILPQVMRENKIDMWIHVMRTGNPDALSIDLGGTSGYFIFTDRGGDRIERAVLDGGGMTVRQSGVYDIILPQNTGHIPPPPGQDLRKFVAERNPHRIGINMSEQNGVADGISHTDYLALVDFLGKPYKDRLVSAEKLIADFRSRRVASEIALFTEVADITREIMETALSNKVITLGATSLADVAWWIKDEHMRRGFGFGSISRLPPVYIRYPDGHEISSNDYIIQRGDLITIDYGVSCMNFETDMKRMAYVLREGETRVPPEIQDAFDHAMRVHDILRKNIVPGGTGAEILESLYRKVEEEGYVRMEIEDDFENADWDNIEVNIGSHSVGNRGHCIGPAIWIGEPWLIQHVVQPNNLLALEFVVYMPVPEWEHHEKSYISIEDNVLITENGIENLYPQIKRILLIY